MSKKGKSIYHFEAQAVVQALGIIISRGYKFRYLEGSALPLVPDYAYDDMGWAGWTGFLDKGQLSIKDHETNVQSAVEALVAWRPGNYMARRQEDPRLPSPPSKVFANHSWTKWAVFFDDMQRK